MPKSFYCLNILPNVKLNILQRNAWYSTKKLEEDKTESYETKNKHSKILPKIEPDKVESKVQVISAKQGKFHMSCPTLLCNDYIFFYFFQFYKTHLLLGS